MYEWNENFSEICVLGFYVAQNGRTTPRCVKFWKRKILIRIAAEPEITQKEDCYQFNMYLDGMILIKLFPFMAHQD